MKMYVGMPQHNDTPLLDACAELNAPIMVSSNRCWDPKRRRFALGHALLHSPQAVKVDSSGFVAMMLYQGYRWEPEEYLEWIINDWPAHWPRPEYAAMDYCCEQAIAKSRAEVHKRIDMTIKSCWYMFELVQQMRDDGMHWAENPMPVIQGRTADDYIQCLRQLPKASLYGVGSVCGRHLYGPEGLLPVIEAICMEIRSGVGLHAFGVKGDAIGYLRAFRQVESVDSMAWDIAARRDAHQRGVSCSYALRAKHLKDWYTRQVDVPQPRQMSLFG